MINLKNSSQRLDQQDVQILVFINEFGFCELRHLEIRFGFNKPCGSQVMQRLLKMGLIIYDRIFHGRPGVYRLTPLGARYTELSPLKQFPLGNYIHEITLCDVYLKLCLLYPDSIWISERRLKRDRFLEGMSKGKHIPDGMLILKEDRRIAIEVELTLKSIPRLEQIFKNYGTQFEINEVWYYCSESIIATLRKCAMNTPWIKIFSLKEVMEEEAMA